MKRAALKPFLITMLTLLMCVGFSSYVFLSQFQVVKEASITINEEDSETAEKSVTELNYFIEENSLLNKSFALITSQAFHYRNRQLPDFSLIPNTPPPNLA